MVHPKHVDDRGMFQELFRDSETFVGFDVKQISQCTINPGQTRGGHYHREMIEAFIIVEGEMILTQSNIAGTDSESILMTTEKNQLMYNEPWVWHEVTSEKGCKFLILLDREFNPEDPDTYTHEE